MPKKKNKKKKSVNQFEREKNNGKENDKKKKKLNDELYSAYFTVRLPLSTTAVIIYFEKVLR